MPMTHRFTCTICKQEIIHENNFTIGYGVQNGQKVCYECCGKQDREWMKNHDKIMLYLTGEDSLILGEKPNRWMVTNWPGTLKISCSNPRIGRHNIARTRYDVWFRLDGQNWHGVQYGENTQVCYCRKVK